MSQGLGDTLKKLSNSNIKKKKHLLPSHFRNNINNKGRRIS